MVSGGDVRAGVLLYLYLALTWTCFSAFQKDATSASEGDAEASGALAAQLQTAYQYIKGMLTNLKALPIDR